MPNPNYYKNCGTIAKHDDWRSYWNGSISPGDKFFYFVDADYYKLPKSVQALWKEE